MQGKSGYGEHVKEGKEDILMSKTLRLSDERSDGFSGQHNTQFIYGLMGS